MNKRFLSLLPSKMLPSVWCGIRINAMIRDVVLLLIITALTPVLGQSIAGTSPIQLQSPNGKLTVVFRQPEIAPGKRQMTYQVNFEGKPIILESGLGLQIDNHIFEQAMAQKMSSQPGESGAGWCDDLVITNVVNTQRDTIWKPVYGERSLIRDHYNQMEIQLQKASNANYRLHVMVRAYNEGVAIRYIFPEHPQGLYHRVMAENTEFTLPAGTQAWFTGWAQGPYTRRPLAEWPDAAERPLTLELPSGLTGHSLYVSLAEAALTDYVLTKYKLLPGKPNTLVTTLYESVDLLSDAGTPWRVIMVATTPGLLLEQNDILLNLNPPSRLAKTDWIRPGKVLRDMTLTTEGARACIDFAAANNLQYILFDWKWYGPTFSFTSDARRVVAPIDMPGIIAYGKSKNVGVILYVNQQALYKQMDELFPLYKKWGVAGVKFGFVPVGSHRWTTWLTEAKRKAGENELLVNIHDEYRPTGTNRTYPNVLTQEGIRGNEEWPDATHDTVLPFTRYLAGAGDYTIAYYDSRLKNSHAHQLAMCVIAYSPLQAVFWYDTPARYGGEPEIEFFRKVPTVWDDTRVIHDAIGQYVTIARRSGTDWFVGTITNNEGRSLNVPLDFLPTNKPYMAHIYSDDSTVPNRTQVRIDTKQVSRSQSLEINLVPRGGQAVWLSPTTK